MAPKAEKNLNDLFKETLKDIYYAEKQILRALEQIFELLGVPAPTCDAIIGIIDEGK